jgi:hypothetical protein
MRYAFYSVGNADIGPKIAVCLVVVGDFINSSASSKGGLECAVDMRELLPLSFTDEQK